ncbi:hypothetical protein KFK09_007967 [Dendrobium nobile]|uniref:Uncharacterized protein n=1 Tax=Dendrobium nobile TaxID=94219 RepID=A0A8T3BXZ5_DENNO|nr:hypothetical protein KFK09_007967 [Dendrobium nobile]
MGNCAGKPKTVDGVKPEAADQVADDAKATILNSTNGETTAEDKNDDAKATNENGEKKEPVIGLLDTKEEAEDIKKPALVTDELKTEAPAEAEKVAEEVEEKKLEVST